MMDYIQDFALKNKAIPGYGYDMNASNMSTLIETKRISLKELHNEAKSERKCRLAFSQSNLEIQTNSDIISTSSEKTSHLQII
jgi:hypothetical protein